MTISKVEAYKNRRVGAAVRGGFTRLKIEGTAKQKSSLKKSLTRLWDKSISTECPLLCGRKLTPRTAAFCHNVALASGGPHSISNMYMACGSCNKAQRTLCKDEYLRLRQVIIEHFGEPTWLKIRRWLAGAKH